MLVRKVECVACGFVVTSLELEAVVRNGYWPGSTVNINCIYDIELLDFWNLQQSFQPKCSETGFLKVLSQLSTQNARVSSTVMYQKLESL